MHSTLKGTLSPHEEINIVKHMDPLSTETPKPTIDRSMLTRMFLSDFIFIAEGRYDTLSFI